MSIPEQGHGPVVIHQNEDGSVQLRDNLTRFWCACGVSAVEYFENELPQYRFQCVKHSYETRNAGLSTECLVGSRNAALTKDMILSMEEEELSISVAEHIFNAKIVTNEDYGTAYILVGDMGRQSTQPLKGEDWQFAKWRNSEEKAWLDCPKYADNMSDAWKVEEKIKWIAAMGQGLMIGYYMAELKGIVGNYGFELVHATPKQRSQAALLAVLGYERD